MTDQQSSNKRIAKNTLLLYMRMLFMMLIGLYTSRVVLNTLGVSDFGIYNVVGGVVAIFSFIKGSLNGATSRYITIELGKGNDLQLQRIFSISLIIHALFSLLIVLIAETIGLWFLTHEMQIPEERMNAALWVYHSSILTAVTMMMSAPYNAVIIAHERMNAFAYISILESVLKLSIVFMLPAFPTDKLALYAILIALVQLLIRMCYQNYCLKHFRETRFRWYWDSKLFKEVLAYMGWTLNGNLAVVGYTQGLNVLLNLFFGSVVNAARGIAAQVEGVVKSFCLNFQTALNPQLTKTYAQGNLSHMHQLIVLSSKFSFFLLYFLSLPIILEINPILNWWLGIVPEHTVCFVRLVLISSMLSAIANPLVTSIHATGNIKRFQIIEGSILLSIVPISYLFLKTSSVPPETVFIIYLFIEMCAQCARVKIVLPQIKMSQKRYIQDIIVPILKVLILSPVIPISIYCLFDEHTFISFLIVSIACVTSSIISILLVGCTMEEKKKLISQISSFKQKIIKQ